MTNAEKIAVLQAAEAGKRVQWKSKQCNDDVWHDAKIPEDIWFYHDWRIAPEPPPPPKAREWWLNTVENLGVEYAHRTKASSDSHLEEYKSIKTIAMTQVHVREVLPNEGWVAFKDREPTPQQYILICYAKGEVRQIEWQSHGFGGWYSNERPTHWQPMIPLPNV